MSAKSKLLNQPLPSDLARLARSEGVAPEKAWLLTKTDLDLAGHYQEMYLVVQPQRLFVLGWPADDGTVVRTVLRRGDIQELRTRQGVGGGFLEALVEGVYLEVLAYSNAKADVFHKAARKLQDWSQGEQPQVTAADDLDPRTCDKCGMPLQFKGDVCRNCIRHGAVFLRVLKLMRPYARRAAVMMALVLIGIALGLIPQQLIRVLVDRVLAPLQAGNPQLPTGTATMWLLGLVGALLLIHVLTAVIGMVGGRLASYVGTQITHDMRSRVFHHLTRQGVGYYDRYSVGQLMTRVNNDTGQMRGFIQQLTSGFLAQMIRVTAVGIVLFSLNWKLALITLLPAPLVILSAVFFWKRIYPRYHRVWDARSKLNGVLNTILSGIRVVKAFGKEGRERGRFDGSSGRMRNDRRSVEYQVALFNPSIGLLFQLGGILVWFIGGQWVLGHEMTLGKLMAFLGYLGMLYAPLRQLTQLTNWLTGFLTATQRVFEILDAHPEIVETQTPQPLDEDACEIRFEHVTFGYERHEPVIREVSFTVRPGEHIGIVGKSGSGKTTLVNLLARFYDVDEGRVLIGGQDVRDLVAL